MNDQCGEQQQATVTTRTGSMAKLGRPGLSQGGVPSGRGSWVARACGGVVGGRGPSIAARDREERGGSQESKKELRMARVAFALCPSGQVLVHAVVSLAALQVVALNEVLNAGLDCNRARLEPPAQLSRRLVVVVSNNNEEEK